MSRLTTAALFVVFAVCAGFAQSDQPLLLQKPALNKTHIVFSFAGDLWSVPREGGDAVRLTTAPGTETNPVFSPDGTQIAFTGEYDGNVDVYVMPAAGGVPRRLTYHPGADTVVGWSPDGKKIVFGSGRNSYSGFGRLFTLPVEGGGLPEELPLPMAAQGAFSPDGARIAYLPLAPAFATWKRYRGGRTTPIWIANLSDSKIEKVPRDNSNDFNPMWIGSRVYFLSDRDGPVTLFAYDTAAKKVARLLPNTGYDLKWAAAGPSAIVYEQFGVIYLFDLKSEKPKKVDIRVSGDIPTVRASFERVGTRITKANLSPTGARALFEARGEIFTVPAEKGEARNLTNTSGVAERDPAWSPDGKLIAYFSDESGEYQLHLAPQTGLGEVQKINLGDPPAFYYGPVWSPDSKKIVYSNSRLEICYLDLAQKTPKRIDKDTYHVPARGFNPSWSPDSKWIAYTKILKNHLRAVFVYSLDTGETQQITDGMSDAQFATFDKNGKYLYFTASTNTGLSTAWLDMTSYEHPVVRSVYAAVLSKDDPSPVAPESDEEKGEEEAAAAATKKAAPDAAKAPAEKAPEKVTVRIDFPNIGQRIVALPIPARDYVGLEAGKSGLLYLAEAVQNAPTPEMAGMTIQKFDLKTRKVEKVLDGVRSFSVSQNGEKMLVRQGARWFIAATSAPPKPGEGTLNVDAMQARVEPRAEWKQMYNEVWRIERDFFYDPGLHGVNLKTAPEKYRPYLENIASRPDLSYLFQEMLGELSVGHLGVGGGALPDVKRVPGGLLGADYKIENGRYRFARVYNGENWNPDLKAPLTQPGVNVVAGEYLLAVNGKDLRPPDNVYAALESTSGKSVLLRVGPNPDGAGSREVTVIPVASETGLRNLAWIEDNRRLVDKLSNGRLAYVYLPNTSTGGYSNFIRYYFAQIGKEGAVIDERFNGGGSIADFIIDYMSRPLTNFFMTREGEPFSTPQNAIFGPKVMIINEYAGSGGDAMPWLFRERKLGALVGKRTWGGLVGIFGFPPLVDGGSVTAPNLAFYNARGEWDVENHGVLPDIEVEFEPAAVRAGRDPQLEKAVEVVMQQLKEHPLPVYKKPAFPNYHKSGQ
jgi:tricorn protease